jgi:hypothetical protein
LQQGVAQLRKRQKDMETPVTQNGAVEKTLIELSLDSTSRLSGTKNALQNSVQELQSVSGSQLDTMSIQVEGVSENVQVMLERMGKLNQQLTNAQNIIQGMGAKVGGNEARNDPLQRTKANRKRH